MNNQYSIVVHLIQPHEKSHGEGGRSWPPQAKKDGRQEWRPSHYALTNIRLRFLLLFLSAL